MARWGSQKWTSGESGNTLISVLIAVAILSIVGAASMTLVKNSQVARRSITMDQAASEVDSVLQSAIISHLRQDGCFNAYTAFQSDIAIDSYGTMTPTKTIAVPSAMSAAISQQGGLAWQSAIMRCRSPRYVPGVNNSRYFCLQFRATNTSGSEPGSFFRS